MMDKDYLHIINGLDTIKLCIIGQDPYDTSKAMGIPFCTKTFDQLFHEYTCGKDVLFSLGYPKSIIEKMKKDNGWSVPKDLFIWLAKEKGIVFLNLSYDVILKEETTDKYKAIADGYAINEPIISKSQTVIKLGTTYKGIYKDIYSDFNETLVHPSNINKESEHEGVKKQWYDCYDKEYLKKYI